MAAEDLLHAPAGWLLQPGLFRKAASPWHPLRCICARHPEGCTRGGSVRKWQSPGEGGQLVFKGPIQDDAINSSPSPSPPSTMCGSGQGHPQQPAALAVYAQVTSCQTSVRTECSPACRTVSSGSWTVCCATALYLCQPLDCSWLPSLTWMTLLTCWPR